MEDNKKIPKVTAQMLVRKPVAQVFEAFIDPEITRHFWFTKGSGKLETGKKITWEWEMYNASSTVFVKEIIPGKKISVEWDQYSTVVDFEFKEIGADATYVTITQYGFKTTGDALLKDLNDAAGGFTTVVDGLKAYMEYGIDLNLTADKFPKEVR